MSSGAVSAAIGFAVIIGLSFGLYPATKAARQNIIEALRFE